MPFKGSNAKQIQMFGQCKFSAGASDKLFICEGEIDTLSVYQALGGSWACVGIPGAEHTEKAIKNNLEFIERFNEVVLFFDNDAAGKKATQVALDILPFGKVKYINEYPSDCKDANDILVKKGQKLLRETAFYKAAEYIPDGVVNASDITFEPDSFEVSMYPWDSWNKKLYARRGGELTVYTAGTGIGKSTILRAIYSDLIKQGEKTAMIMLEETVAETKADLMSQVTGKPIRKILAQVAVNEALAKKGKDPLFPDVEPLTADELLSCEKAVDDSGLILIDHSKGYNLESITSQIRFLAKSKGVRHILLDHITLLIGSDNAIDNEVKALDVAMKAFRVLCEETGINLDMISHIRKRGNGAKSVNAGAPISMEELRGSGSLTQIANNVLTLERDQQDPDDRNLTVCRSLKSRLGGFTGEIGRLRYDPETGELTEEEKQVDSGFTDKTNTDY
jgi:twinkle protein